jgi:hypothetical protein
MYSLLQRLSSLRHGFWFGVSERIRWSRGAHEETPASELCSVDLEQGERIAALRERYQVQFERRMSAATKFPNAEFVVADYTRYPQPAELITAWFPFLTPKALLAWHLPLALLRPDCSIGFDIISSPTVPFFMVNHGMQEWALAERLCTAAGLRLVSHWSEPSTLSLHRLEPPAVSWWRHD